jgi:uncharacterized spore protein YtfJ
MSNDVTGLMGVIANELKSMARTENVIGDPIQAGDATIVPVVQVSVGFGAGGEIQPPAATEGKSRPLGGGGGGGVRVTPIGFLVVRGDDIRLLTVRETTVGGLAAVVPVVLDKILDKIGAGKAAKAAEPAEPAAAPAPEVTPSE